MAPRQFPATITQVKRFRFQCIAAVNAVTISAYELAAMQSFILSSTTARPLIDRVRLVSVEMFAPMTATLIPVTVSLEWLNNSSTQFNCSSRIITDTSMTASVCAHVHCVPEQDSIASKWLSVGSQAVDVVALSAPINTIIDFVFEFALNDGAAPPPVATILATAQPLGSIGVVSPDATMAALGLPALLI